MQKGGIRREADGGEIISKHYSAFIVCCFYCLPNETVLHALWCAMNNRKYFHSNNLTLLMEKEREKKKKCRAKQASDRASVWAHQTKYS